MQEEIKSDFLSPLEEMMVFIRNAFKETMSL